MQCTFPYYLVTYFNFEQEKGNASFITFVHFFPPGVKASSKRTSCECFVLFCGHVPSKQKKKLRPLVLTNQYSFNALSYFEVKSKHGTNFSFCFLVGIVVK